MIIQEILEQLDIPFLEEGNHHCRPGWIQLDCPYCGKDSNKWHLGFNLTSNYLHCWKCGAHPLEYTLMELSDKSFYEIKQLLSNISITQFKLKKTNKKLELPKNIEPLQKPHIKYLLKRNFTKEQIKDLINIWELQAIGLSINLSWRLFIPIKYQGNVVSWTTRSIAKKTNLRYISAGSNQEKISHKSLLYGEDFAKENIIIVEGPVDVWKIGPGAVATLGLSYSSSQIAKMIKYDKIFICFDNEKKAQQRAKKLCDDLSVFGCNVFNIQLKNKDAGEADQKEISGLQKLIK